MALQQCREFFRNNSKVQPTPFYDTAGAVKHVVGNQLQHAAAIASIRAATQYGGHVLRKGIEDNKQNFTRFFLVSRQKKVLPGANKTSLAFAVRNVSGVLFKALSVFALRDIDLSKIESRPVPGRPWEYVFYADILRGDDEAARHALRHLSEICEFVRVLGIYSQAR